MSKELIYKLCIFGDINVGKTSLTQASIQKNEKKPPVCIDIAIKVLTINSSKIILQIWNLRSDPQFQFIFPIFMRGVSGGIFMYDITNYSSIKNVEKWLTLFRDNLPNEKKKIPLLMVGGKLDLHKERVISRKYVKKISKKYKIVKNFECSSKTGENVDKIFEFLTRAILKIERDI
ncbi:MAG: Rab family GTPase [Promethearchaeota archaeon]|jgi:small GTP-binding protein